ncbi:hypothetical protein SDRG_17422 [Saprolegnia diclina VS20]|uniref:Uncharacterized protein n=1 Tax=Saprolegnia diclina (strain VS20) TaxID=1156394 RepID=T0PUL4_SAPDV|nr:hypothetical protein SDRG_17422 [Saprolegnia diclina VS20]EQC24685.1 hypothetical protein SDRG_17422 [Saprolegnia diclina VS20]|eukprot:XP_008621886.1 hypothetical protein SDRG_17422 [Saprolegnia diclina VS20]
MSLYKNTKVGSSLAVDNKSQGRAQHLALLLKHVVGALDTDDEDMCASLREACVRMVDGKEGDTVTGKREDLATFLKMLDALSKEQDVEGLERPATANRPFDQAWADRQPRQPKIDAISKEVSSDDGDGKAKKNNDGVMVDKYLFGTTTDKRGGKDKRDGGSVQCHRHDKDDACSQRATDKANGSVRSSANVKHLERF